jgi:hypothetical protein
MPRDPLVELEAARANVLEEAERFVEELEPVLGPSLHAGFERLRLAQPGHVGRLDGPTLAALEDAVGRAIELGVAETVERLRSPEIWLSPLTAPELPPRSDPARPLGLPEWVARLGGPAREGSSLGRLDEMTNRSWKSSGSGQSGAGWAAGASGSRRGPYRSSIRAARSGSDGSATEPRTSA